MSIAEPAKIITPWADTGSKNPIPQNANNTTGEAGYDKGFPDITMTPPEAGGIPPAGPDFNGIFYNITEIIRYIQAGGQPLFNDDLSTAINGYPKGAILLGVDGVAIYKNMISGNASNPNINDEGWARIDIIPVQDVSILRTYPGSVGQVIFLESYNSGWAAVSTPPTGGGKFRWVSDSSLVDDGVFVFKPAGASGAWVRQYQRKVTPYLAGAKGDNVDDTAAMLRCFAVAKDRRLNVHFDKGQYKYTQTPEVGPECSVTGEFSVAELLPVGCDGFKFTSSDAVGGRAFGGFVLLGTGANQAGYTAIAVDPGQDVIKRTTGVSFADFQVFNFKTFCNAKNLWHSTFRSVNATNVCNGIIFRGRCVSNEVGSGTKIVRGSGALVSGECVGVQFIESSDYTPSIAARPEGCTVTASVLIFGFDVGVDVDSMLAGGIFGSDIDFCRKVGVRYRFWDGKPTISPNWIAGDSAYSSQPFTGVLSAPVAVQRATGPNIDHITMTTFNGNPGDIGIKLSSLNGRANVSRNLISHTMGIGIYDDGSRFNTFNDNEVQSPNPIFMFSSGGNSIDGNRLTGGPITNNSPIGRNNWGCNSGDSCTGDTFPVSIPAGQTSATISLSSFGYPLGISLVGDVAIACYHTGTVNPGATWASYSSDGLSITAYMSTPSAIDVQLFVTITIR